MSAAQQGLSFQEQMPGNLCFGCGPENEQGLQIKSYWSESVPGETVCNFMPQPHHNAGSAKILNGGIIATVMDCHSAVTAVAHAYRNAGRAIGSEPQFWYVTGSFDLAYKAPALLDHPIRLLARIVETMERKSLVDCELWSADTLCTSSRMLAVQVPEDWHDV
jgi:acyl-coenzyme A thioesterase PaaI-like protein